MLKKCTLVLLVTLKTCIKLKKKNNLPRLTKLPYCLKILITH